jgi:hypothetical protein
MIKYKDFYTLLNEVTYDVFRGDDINFQKFDAFSSENRRALIQLDFGLQIMKKLQVFWRKCRESLK